MKRLLVVVLCLSAACKCGKAALGPLEDAKPADLGADGLVIEQPADGETIGTAWVAVLGWFDPTKYDGVFVTGAPTDGFYAPAGHVGPNSVHIVLRTDGRFVAPRVPLDSGDTTVRILVFKDGAVKLNKTLTIKGGDPTNLPVTVTAAPAIGAPPLMVTLAGHAASSVDGWQWDFEGDGRMDEESATPTHSYNEGNFAVMARTRIDGRWAYGLAPIVVSPTGTVTHTSTAIGDPLALSVIPRHRLGSEAMPTGELAARYVAVSEATAVKVFDAKLDAVTTLSGLDHPGSVAGDELGRLYVADTNHDRVVCFRSDGTLDPSFGDGGVLVGPTDDTPLSKPIYVEVSPESESFDDGGFAFTGRRSIRVVEQSGRTLLVDASGNAGSYDSSDGAPVDAFDVPYDLTGHPAFFNRWLKRDGKLLQPGGDGYIEAPSPPGFTGFAIKAAALPYWAVLDGQGDLHEWFGARWNTRMTDLDFAAKLIRIDAAGSRYLEIERRKAAAADQPTVGPVILYIAGSGRLERRVVKPMKEGPL